MAAWTLWRALGVLAELPARRRRALRDRLHLTREELVRWQDISRRMFVPFHGDVISQFEGYDDLEELDWDGYRERYGNIHRLDRILESEGDTTNRYKASKQADVLMLFYLLSAEELAALFDRLGYGFDADTIPRTIDYYSGRTAHGSTLSGVVNSWVLARLDRERSWQLFSEALESDVADAQGGTTKEGIHLGAMAGTIDLLQRGYTGLEARGDSLVLNPTLPEELRRLEFSVHYRRSWDIDVMIRDGVVRVRVPSSDAGGVVISCAGRSERIAPGESFEARYA
jgi:alpha,alpha-trehalase